MASANGERISRFFRAQAYLCDDGALVLYRWPENNADPSGL